MFTGIIEAQGLVKQVISNGQNRTFWIESTISADLKIDQSISHNGVCLTIEEIKDNSHRVTAIPETLKKTNLADWTDGTVINLERSLKLGDRLDGHIVQGHIDCVGICKNVKDEGGSWVFQFEFPKKMAKLVIEKGSITINGISLTAFNVKKKSFSVAIVPYTFENTNIRYVKSGYKVNLEFDILGKYLLRSKKTQKEK
jgi:riboflavin synthase